MSRGEPYRPVLSPGKDRTMLRASMIRRPQNFLAVVAPLLLVACRGREPAGGLERDAAILTARTLGLAYLRSQQFAQAETAFAKIVALAPDQALATPISAWCTCGWAA